MFSPKVGGGAEIMTTCSTLWHSNLTILPAFTAIDLESFLSHNGIVQNVSARGYKFFLGHCIFEYQGKYSL